MLEKGKGKSKDKRENILIVLKNLEHIFTGIYIHYDNASKTKSELEFEESVAERTKIRRQIKPDDKNTMDMSDSENEESAVQGQSAEGLKIQIKCLID